MSEFISVIVKDVDSKPKRITIKNDLKAMQAIVGGRIEAVPISDKVLLVCNEEGLIHHLPYNCTVAYHSIYGTFFLCGADGESFTSCPYEVTLQEE
jgi:hypothetical protein